MGVFQRTRDIIAANVHSMLDKAENPEKLGRLMVVEIESAIAAQKSAAADAIAARRRARGEVAGAKERAEEWRRRAELAVAKGRDDLAREALTQKRLYEQRAEQQEAQLPDFDALIEQHRQDLEALEERLRQTRERVSSLRRSQAASAATGGRKGSDPFARFDDMEHRVQRAEAEMELGASADELRLQAEFRELEENAAVEKELEELKRKS